MNDSPTHTARPPRAARAALTVGGGLLLLALTACGVGGTSALPDGFPKDVPVSSARIISAEKSDANWQVEVQVDGEQGQQDALEALTDKGFIITGSSGETAADRIYSLSKGKTSVRLGFEQREGDHLVTYGVAAQRGEHK